MIGGQTLLETADVAAGLFTRYAPGFGIVAGTITEAQAWEIDRAISRLASLNSASVGFATTAEILELTDAVARTLEQNLPHATDDKPF